MTSKERKERREIGFLCVLCVPLRITAFSFFHRPISFTIHPMELAMTAILIFAGASFFFALAETALFSLSKWQLRQLAERHPLAGKTVAQLLERPQDLLATIAL